MVDPRVLCTAHLLGEHRETHMAAGSLSRGHLMSGHIQHQLLEVHNLERRHDELAAEIERRGYNHRSPFQAGVPRREAGRVCVQCCLAELWWKCSDCRALQVELDVGVGVFCDASPGDKHCRWNGREFRMVP
jgi:hypothetical protein